ncbi:MAG TPA: GNAT family N-acetyltransferase [Burkholderiales bacterium]|nr:GNAT family N-acetyltransferase [Burkholderiales bacterium]
MDVVPSLSGIEAAAWNRLAGDNPFLRHEFLSALHETGCAAPDTGWTPQYLIERRGAQLVAAMPLYVKDHSYGEYVFDWAWADAYYRHGLDYYPKLICAVPFTPVTGTRLLATDAREQARLIEGALALARELRVSSLHCLFPTPDEAQAMSARGLQLRRSVQFHWLNHDYTSFEDFLAGMSHDKRKKIRQERRRVREAGIEFRWLDGTDITREDWAFFNRCYRHTYREHHSTPYLNLEFFQRIGRTMPENFALIVAERGGHRIAASLNVRNAERLYGRYWGALEYHSGLHFETCYYQGIEYCIARGLRVFEGGSRGEHKLARGLMPTETLSTHWLAHREFSAAIAAFLTREGANVAHYVDELNERRPFKETPPTGPQY